MNKNNKAWGWTKKSVPAQRALFEKQVASKPVPNNRTKLSAKASAFVPSGGSPTPPPAVLPFVPMAAVTEAWQRYERRFS